MPTMIETFDRASLRAFHAEALKAVEAVAAAHGVSVEPELNARFAPTTAKLTFTFGLAGTDPDTGEDRDAQRAEDEMWELLQDLDALADGRGWPARPTRSKPAPPNQGVLL